MNAPKEIDFSSLDQALNSLKRALERPLANDLERDGAIQRFEYTFELCWKYIRRSLLLLGRANVSGSPRPLLRDAQQERWIDDAGIWFEFLEARNTISHTYNQEQAEKVFQVVKRFSPHAEKLLDAMKRCAGS